MQSNLPISNKLIDPTLALSLSKKIGQDIKLQQVAEEFEALFISEMLKRAEEAKLAKSILSSEAEGTYKSLLNQERSKVFAKEHNFGIAEALVRQFSPRSSSNTNTIDNYGKE